MSLVRRTEQLADLLARERAHLGPVDARTLPTLEAIHRVRPDQATPRRVAEELDEWLRTGRARLGNWVSEEPQAAFEYTSGAGATILLMDDLYPEFALLHQYLLRDAWREGGPTATI
jgi:hypothetical protein